MVSGVLNSAMAAALFPAPGSVPCGERRLVKSPSKGLKKRLLSGEPDW